jgi:AcrR family transcriptional regulator
MSRTGNHSQTRQQILRAALKTFAHSGYAAASVQQIVNRAGVSKPALYYYFSDKAGLFQALVDEAHDERYRLMRDAAGRSNDLRAQLVEILAGQFEFFGRNRDLVRIAFSTAFAAPGEVPRTLHCQDKCERNFEFIHSLIRRGLSDGVLNGRFESLELARGLYGQMNLYVISQLLSPESRLDRKVAERIIKLFLECAAKNKRK